MVFWSQMRHPPLPFHYAHTHPYTPLLARASVQCTHSRLKHAPHARTARRRRGGDRLPSPQQCWSLISLLVSSFFFFLYKGFLGFLVRGDPDIARQIRECQEAYLIEHPSLYISASHRWGSRHTVHKHAMYCEESRGLCPLQVF